jgi:hypothetical protein
MLRSFVGGSACGLKKVNRARTVFPERRIPRISRGYFHSLVRGAFMRRLSLLSAVAITLACSSSSSNSGSLGDGGINGFLAAQACAHDAEAFCERLNACSPFGLKYTFGDVDTCQARDRLSCESLFRLKDSAMTPNNVDACASAVATQTCDDFRYGAAPRACAVPAGSRASGIACTSSLQCQSLSCRTTGVEPCPVCRPLVALGGACTASEECNDGRCQDMKCLPLVEEGAACTQLTACRAPLECVGPGVSDTNPGVCTKPIGVGQPCSFVSDACDITSLGLRCDGATQLCKEVARVVGPGQTCGFDNGIEIYCQAYGICVLPDGGNLGTCRPPPADGEACDASDDHCMWPASCDNGTCRVYDPAAPTTGCPG